MMATNRSTGVNFCPGEEIPGVTTHIQTNHTSSPLLFDLGTDPGEKYVIRPSSKIYKRVMPEILDVVEKHKANLKPGIPQLNMCDPAVMNWAPPGCKKLGRCLPIPRPHPRKCFWPH